VPITRQKSPVFSIVSLPTDSVIVDHAVFGFNKMEFNLIAAGSAEIILFSAVVSQQS
jgi:hypothetical protein